MGWFMIFILVFCWRADREGDFGATCPQAPNAAPHQLRTQNASLRHRLTLSQFSTIKENF